jgi:integrating conjugative element protein (TIGR03759 family)
MRNRSGKYFKNTTLTPVEILGVNARTDEERAQYAVLDAKQEFGKNAKILSFNAAYDRAAMVYKEKLDLPIIRKFNYSKYSPYNYKPVQLRENDKLMLFVKRSENVKPIISYLMSEIESNPSVQLNVYFVDDKKNKKTKTTKSDIVSWAQAQNIPSTMVNDKLITLNFDHGQYAGVNAKGKITGKNKKTPLLILIHDGQSHIVDTGRF